MTQQQKPRSGWQLETETARAYEEDLVPALFIPWAKRLVEQAGVRPGDQVLDVACGTGAVARNAAHAVGTKGSVVGVDLNEGMLEVAKEATRDVKPAIEYRQADAAALPFEDGRFDVVLCQQGFQFMPEKDTVLREMKRVLRPGGRLVFSVWRSLDHNPGWRILSDTLAQHVDPDAAETMASPFAGMDREKIREKLQATGFQDLQLRMESRDLRVPREIEFFRRHGDSSPFADQLSTLDDASWKRFNQALDDALADHMDDEARVLPMQSHVVSAIKPRPA